VSVLIERSSSPASLGRVDRRLAVAVVLARSAELAETEFMVRGRVTCAASDAIHFHVGLGG